MKNALTLAGLATALVVLTFPHTVLANEALLAGTVKSSAGEKMGGVTVSAKAEGATITTTVFTDDAGNYYFPPMPAGKYRVWAQALAYEAAKGDVDLARTRHQDFTLAPIKDFERQVRQLPGDAFMAALPDATPEDARMKRLVRNNCTGCHTPSYVLQHRFDEAGWSAIIDLMKRVNVYGVVLPERPVNGILDFHQKELAAYLARVRGPGENGLTIKPRPRPTGEAA
ncbi:MAG: carboxypeptidase-like regulatory domain-containing protein, partial [Hyphomicrobiaceae bacterium]